ncbi:MAG TPA: polysaccharide biosynthesis protein [Candidatus Choladousia intestinipullorum]|nr:polysaccharide biosynthesis protein [Candidatus Choladousia intestinipullorum]
MKEKKTTGKNFLVQGTILAAASIIAKIIGLIYRIPLNNILGSEGISYYGTSNEIYAILLMISCFNLPLAVSKLVSERVHRGEYRNAHRVFLCAVRFALVVGGGLALFTYIFAGVITKYLMSFELAVYSLRVLAPAIFISAIIGTFRGYFQGYSTMVPTAVSQVIEQIVNAVVTLVCADIMFSYGASLAEKEGNASLGPAWGAAGGTFGTVASITVALLFMMFVYTAQKKTLQRNMRRDRNTRPESERLIYHQLVMTILPVILSTVIYNISNVADQGIFNKVLQGQGYTAAQYGSIWGIYSGQFRVLMNVPLALASCMAPSIVPSLTAAMANRNRSEARAKIRISIRFTMLLTIPCAAGMAALARPIITMLFSNETGVPLSVGILQTGSLMIILYALSTLTTGILQGLGQLKQPLINCSISLVIHFILLYFLLTVANLNIYAVVYANIIFALIVCILNAVVIRRFIHYKQEWYKTFAVPAIASVIMAAAVYIVYSALNLFAGNTVSTILSIIVGVIVYGIGLVSFRGITIEEIATFPKGHMIIKLLRRLGLAR